MSKFVSGLLRPLVAILLLTLAVPASAITTKEKQVRALETTIDELETHYGLQDFKAEQLGVSLKGLERKYKKLIDKAMTLEEFEGLAKKQNRELLSPEEYRMLMIGLYAELQDGHANTGKPGFNAATLGFKTVAIDGRLYYTGMRKHLSLTDTKTTEPLKLGDEVIAIDGVAVQEIAKQNILYSQSATYNSRMISALESTTVVPYSIARKKEEGAPVTVTFKRDNKEITGNFHWIELRDYVELRSRFPEHFPNPSKDSAERNPERYTYGDRGTVYTYLRQGIEGTLGNRNKVTEVGDLLNLEIGKAQKAKHAKDPLTKIKPVNRLHSYIARYKDKNIGVIRIPSYNPGGLDAASNEFLWLAQIVERMEQQTDAVIIDQTGNQGGYVHMFIQLLSLFAGDNVLSLTDVNYRLNETLVSATENPSLGGEIEEDNESSVANEAPTQAEPNYAEVKLNKKTAERFRKLLDENGGAPTWSGLIPDWGVGNTNQLFPHKRARLTKPLLVVNDVRSASGGDFFPRVLQANGIAPVMGPNTSAALGAPVNRRVDSMPGSEMPARCPFAYCEIGGLPLENVGVVPDIPQPIGVHDLKDGFKFFAKGVLDVVLELEQGVNLATIKKRKSAEITKRMAISNGNALHTVKTEVARFKMQIEKAEKSDKDLNSSSATLSEIYTQMFTSLEEQRDAMAPLDWRHIQLPLPQQLLDSDVILRSLYQTDEVVDRLKTMAKRPAFSRQANVKKLLKQIATSTEKLDRPVMFADPCGLLLEKRPDGK